MRFTRDGLLTAVIVVLALFLGSQVVQLIPSPEEQFGRPFEHHATVGEAVEVRTGTLSVNGVQTSREVEIHGQVAATTALWLVVDFEWLAKDRPSPYAASEVRLLTPDGRTYGGVGPVPVACIPGQPHITLGCQALIELPADALEGAALRLPAALNSELDDVVIVDLGIDAARAAELAQPAERIQLTGPVEQP